MARAKKKSTKTGKSPAKKKKAPAKKTASAAAAKKKAPTKKTASAAAAKKKAPTKKTASAAAAKKKRASRERAAPLTAAQRAAMTHPPTNYDDVIERFARTWRNEGDRLRAPGLTPGKLLSLLTKAQRAVEREERVRAALEARLAPLTDARLGAQDVAWRSLLDAWAMTKAQTRMHPELAEAFAFMQDVFTGGGARRAPDGPEPLTEN